MTRTASIRVNVPNEDERIKPGMFAKGIVRANVAASGRVIDPSLTGKWISPMHPEIVKDEPGKCDVCTTNRCAFGGERATMGKSFLGCERAEAPPSPLPTYDTHRCESSKVRSVPSPPSPSGWQRSGWRLAVGAMKATRS